MSFSEQRPPESVFDPVAPATDFDMFESHLQPILAYVLSLRDVKEANKLHNLQHDDFFYVFPSDSGAMSTSWKIDLELLGTHKTCSTLLIS